MATLEIFWNGKDLIGMGFLGLVLVVGLSLIAYEAIKEEIGRFKNRKK